jgi:hypothetical protein
LKKFSAIHVRPPREGKSASGGKFATSFAQLASPRYDSSRVLLRTGAGGPNKAVLKSNQRARMASSYTTRGALAPAHCPCIAGCNCSYCHFSWLAPTSFLCVIHDSDLLISMEFSPTTSIETHWADATWDGEPPSCARGK